MVTSALFSGRFISFEGIDGAGKSTHLQTIVDTLKKRLSPFGKKIVATREPGGTQLGERLRALLLHEAMNLETEALLMFAARREHLAQVIEPALIRGDWVVCDRFTDASFAYQGAGRGLSFERLTQLEHWVQRGLTPHLTFLFDLPVAIAAERLVTAREPDKFEAESTTFFNRVREGYLKRVDAEPHRFIVIDASQPLDTVTKCVADILERDKRLWP